MGTKRVLGVSVCPGKRIPQAEAEQFLNHIQQARGVDREFALRPDCFLPNERTVRLFSATLDPQVDDALRDAKQVCISTEELQRLFVDKTRIKDVRVAPCYGFILPLNTEGHVLIISAQVRNERGVWEEQSVGLTNVAAVKDWVQRRNWL